MTERRYKTLACKHEWRQTNAVDLGETVYVTLKCKLCPKKKAYHKVVKK